MKAEDEELARAIGAAARLAREELRLTQEDIAERVGVSVEFYARIERGTSLPSVRKLVRIADVLGVSADALLDRETSGNGQVRPAWIPEPPPAEPPEIRRLVRALRRASPATLRAVTNLVKTLDKERPTPADA